MKTFRRIALIASALSFSVLAHAGTTGTTGAPVSRAQIHADLVAAELAGQYPQSDAHYPEPVSDPALARVARREANVEQAYGADSATSVASGRIGARGQSPVSDVYKGS
jgi:hypothetical protein